MASLDLIQASLAAPMDWGVFERLTYEILLQDDFPSLRKLGGVGDAGADAVEEVFYQNEQRVETVVQVTSEQAQVSKFGRTVKRLRAAGVEFDQLTILYRDPVANDVRRKIREAADGDGIAFDIRDESYLVGQLGKLENGIFARYFQDGRAQVERLLADRDPLQLADDRLVHAMLASLGAYVAHPGARLVRSTLFDRTVLAALVGGPETATLKSLEESLRKLLPNEALQSDQIDAALKRLEKDGFCKTTKGAITPTPKALDSVGAALLRIGTAFIKMLSSLIADVCAHHHLDDAKKGRLERNLRMALTLLVRLVKPTEVLQDDAVSELQHSDKTFLHVLGNGLHREVARTAVASLIAFVRDPANSYPLVALARSYAGLSLRNQDPLGRRWQLNNLSRTVTILDTDVVLYSLIKELPEHEAVKASLVGLAGVGVTIIVPGPVMDETAGHIGRAERTFRRFGSSLGRLSAEAVDAKVWHAIVRGFYYSQSGDTVDAFHSYLARYYDHDDPLRYVHFLLAETFSCQLLPTLPVRAEDEEEFKAIVEKINKEPQRLKAPYRDEEQMKERTEEHVAMALYAATMVTPKQHAVSEPNGFVVSNDAVFQQIQEFPEWRPRHKMHLSVSQVVTLAEWVAGVRLSDQQLITLVFDPVLAAAAEEIADDLLPLAQIGIDLRHTDPRRLEWDLRKHMDAQILDFRHAMNESPESRIQSGLNLASRATALGYKIDPNVAEVVSEYTSVLREVADERERRKRAEELVTKLVQAASGISKKGKRRVNAILREIGGIEQASSPLDVTVDDAGSSST